MNNASGKPLAGWGTVLTLLALGACSDVTEEIQSPSLLNEEANVILNLPAFKEETIADVRSIELYQYSDGCFVKKMTVDPSKNNTLEIARLPRTRIFALAAHSLGGKEWLSESDFSSITILMPKDYHSAPVFFSSVTEIHEGVESVVIEPRRAVARLDIANSDPDLKIDKVSISGAASSSQIFPMDGRTCECACASYSRTYEEGIEGLAERAFILFETATPITVTVSGRRNGEAVEINAETPAIVRNTLYTVNIEKGRVRSSRERMSGDDENTDDDDYKTTVRVADWQEGDVERATFDLEETAINMAKSYIPEGVKVNLADNTLTIPADGVNGMRLAFLTVKPLGLGSILSDREGVSVNPIEPMAVADGYISEFRVDVAPQPKCADKYQTTVFFKGGSNFFINIEVDPSPYQIPTVRIGGHDWMCFNAVSQDPDEQIFLPKGMTVEKMYTEHFVECIGNFFQFGRPNPFSPWKAYDPNRFSDWKKDSAWESPSMMPLPKGFHVATMDEWHDLLPHGVIIPSTYTTPSGEVIRATLYTFPGNLDNTPSEATNSQKYLKRCVLFESLTTGAKLCLPIAGIKTNVSTEIPTHPNFKFDTKSGYWMKEDRNVLFLEYGRNSDGCEGVKFDHHSWYADGFVMVRGVRN